MKSDSKYGWKMLMPFRVGKKSTVRFCLFPKVRSAGQTSGNTPIYLNVYDLTSLNGYVYWAGLGIFHSGVEVHGVEYAFGAHDYPTSGVFEVEPRQCPGFRFKKSIFMGTTCLDPIQVREFMERHSVNYYGDTYHLIVKNCNHFCKDVCFKLTGNSIPKWVNRLAYFGSLCNCLLPEAIKVSTLRNDTDSASEEKRQLKPSFNCLSSISLHQRQLSSSSLLLSSPLKGCSLLPWEFRKSAPIPLKNRVDHPGLSIHRCGSLMRLDPGLSIHRCGSLTRLDPGLSIHRCGSLMRLDVSCTSRCFIGARTLLRDKS